MDPDCDLYDEACWEAYDESTEDPAFAAFYVGATILAVVIFYVLWSFRRERRPAASSADLRPLIEAHALPFSVCTQCRIIIELEHGFACPQCGSLADCVRVEREEERSMACAAVGLPPD